MKRLFVVIAFAGLIAVTGCGGNSTQEEHNKNLTPVTATGGLKPVNAANGGGGGGGKGKIQSGAPKAASPP
jgi:hypothetical protein